LNLLSNLEVLVGQSLKDLLVFGELLVQAQGAVSDRLLHFDVDCVLVVADVPLDEEAVVFFLHGTDLQGQVFSHQSLL